MLRCAVAGGVARALVRWSRVVQCVVLPGMRTESMDTLTH
jgi:hypothetical protein